MSFTVPDKGEPVNNIQAVWFQEFIEALVDGIDGKNSLLSGGAVTQTASPSEMSVTVAKGACLTNGVLKGWAATVKAIAAADGSNPRIDLVVVDSAGAVQVRTGTAAAAPKPPTRTANDVLLASVLVGTAVTQINTGDLDDKRVVHTVGPLTIYKASAAVTINTTSALTNLFALLLPSGLLLSGKMLRIRCGGTYLSNSGSPVWNFTVQYGGATMFTDATGATSADTDRGAWMLDLQLVASGDATQVLQGVIYFQTPGAKNPPSTGVGDLGVVTHVVTPVRGSAAINSDAGDQTLSVQVQMTVSNLSVETVMEWATVELI